MHFLLISSSLSSTLPPFVVFSPPLSNITFVVFLSYLCLCLLFCLFRQDMIIYLITIYHHHPSLRVVLHLNCECGISACFKYIVKWGDETISAVTDDENLVAYKVRETLPTARKCGNEAISQSGVVDVCIHFGLPLQKLPRLTKDCVKNKQQRRDKMNL